MQRFARIAGHVVAEIIELPDGTEPSAAFHSTLVGALVPAADDVVAGWRLTGGVLVPPPAPAPPTADQLRSHAAARRWQRLEEGISVAGMPVRTDERTRTEISLARTDAADDPAWSTSWKLGTGAFVTIGAAQIEAIAAAVSAHVRDCFAREAAVAAAIAAGTVTTYSEVEAAFA